MNAFKFNIPPKTLALLKKIGRLADERGEAAYAVGGFVRDLFLKKPGADIDITVEGDGVTFAEKLAKLTGSEVEAFTRFGTSIVVIPGFGKVDVATARTESYESPGALPSVRKSGIVQDLYRRDLTINAMALSLSQGYFLKLLDPFEGLEDLQKGRIRALHEKSFIDDPTRIFRAVRFEQRFQKRIEEKTQKWLLSAVRGDYIQRVSGERLRNELRLIFQEPHPERAVWRLDELGVLPHIHTALGVSASSKKVLPHISGAIHFFLKNKIGLDEEKMVWFQSLLSRHGDKEVAAISKRLTLSRVEQKIVTQSAKSYPALLKKLDAKDITVSRMYKLLCPLRPEVQCFLTAAASTGLRKKLEHYFLKVQKSVPWIRGKDLQTMGIPPGFRYSFILLEALNGQLDGKFRSRKEALEWVQKAFIS
jgi:tRNA nucleotidyltransferase (CCA-adding enzyme)